MRIASSLAALAAAAFVVSAGPAATARPGKPPISLTSFGGGYVCPYGYPVHAYGRRFYPVGHPLAPKGTVKPSRCYRNDREAESAGLHAVRAPHGWRMLAGIYLAPSLGYLRSTCKQGVRGSGFAVPCPRFTPNPVYDFAGCEAVANCYAPGRFIMEGLFYGPPSYRGKAWMDCSQPGKCRPSVTAGHAFILAAGRKHVHEIECCGGERAGSAGKIRGHAARWLTFVDGSGLNRNHIMMVWHEHGVTCAVAVYRDTETNRRLVRALAASTTFVP